MLLQLGGASPAAAARVTALANVSMGVGWWGGAAGLLVLTSVLLVGAATACAAEGTTSGDTGSERRADAGDRSADLATCMDALATATCYDGPDSGYTGILEPAGCHNLYR
jgi:hypothetical protein